jgi:hypothetical protein
MPAAQYDFSIEQGSSHKLALVYKDNNGEPIDISNWCARLTWRTNQNITQIFSSENLDYSLYKFILDGPNGKLTLLLPANTTNNFGFSTAKYDLELQSDEDIYVGGGKYTIRLLYGTVTILKRKSKSDSLLDCAQ